MKLKILVVSLATVLLGAGITGAVVFANGDSGGDREARVSSFAGRVAAILELEAQTVEDALTQASRELREEQLNEKIDLMLENGRITGERAEELRQQLADGGQLLGGPNDGQLVTRKIDQSVLQRPAF